MDNKKATLELGTKPVGRLLLQYALPAIVAMTASSLYNMVDSIFIGQGVGAMAISGLAITFPFMNLSAAFGACIGVGSATSISVRLGQKDYTSAKEIFGNNICLNIIVGILFATITLIFLDPILTFFGASEQTLPYALTALCGTLLVLALSRWIAAGSHLFKRFMVFAGDHSLQILTWHFLSFKAVGWLIVTLYHLPLEQLAEFPVIQEFAIRGWWPVYLIAGLALPLCLAALREHLPKR